MKRILLSWSSGKDSAWCLHVLRSSGEYEIGGLLTTFNQAAERVAMHAVRMELVERQAAVSGIPLWPVHLPWPCSNEQYEALMAGACRKALSDGIEGIAFGDSEAAEGAFPFWTARKASANSASAVFLLCRLGAIDCSFCRKSSGSCSKAASPSPVSRMPRIFSA